MRRAVAALVAAGLLGVPATASAHTSHKAIPHLLVYIDGHSSPTSRPITLVHELTHSVGGPLICDGDGSCRAEIRYQGHDRKGWVRKGEFARKWRQECRIKPHRHEC